MINAFMLLSHEWTMSHITHFYGVIFLAENPLVERNGKILCLYMYLIASEAKNFKRLNILAYLSRKKWTTWDNFGSNQLQPWIFRIRLRHLINLGRPAHQMIQAMKSRRDKSSCKQVETSPWGLNGKEDERAKQQLASCLLPTKQHVWEYELLQKETQPQPFTFAAMG